MTRNSKLLWLLAVATVFVFSLVAAEDLDPYGKPKDFNGSGYKVWKSGDGWHIRMKTEEKKREFTGVITCLGPGRIIHAWYVDAEQRKDHGSWNEREIRFRNVVAGGRDGIDFEADCQKLEFNLLLDGERKPKRIFVGERGFNPYDIPFRIKN